VGQHAATTKVKFRPGSPSTLDEKVASGLVWRFGTLDCVNDNLACFKDGFGDSGSFLDVGDHRFYVAKPFPEEVIDVLDPLYDTGSDCGESGDFCPLVEVLALEEDGGSDLPRTARPPLERPPPPKQDLPPPERDVLDAAITDLRAPLDLTADPAKLSEDLERTRRNLIKEAIGVKDTRRRVLSTLHGYTTAQGYTPAGDGPSRAGQVRQSISKAVRGRVGSGDFPRRSLFDGRKRRGDFRQGGFPSSRRHGFGRGSRAGDNARRHFRADKILRPALTLGNLQPRGTAVLFGATQVAASILPARPLAAREVEGRSSSLPRSHYRGMLHKQIDGNRRPTEKAPHNQADQKCDGQKQ
jgi:hypothetical protein